MKLSKRLYIFAALIVFVTASITTVGCAAQEEYAQESVLEESIDTMPSQTDVETEPTYCGRVFVTSFGVNVRKEASSESEPIGLVEDRGTQFLCLGEETDPAGNVWYKIQLNEDTEGFIISDFSVKIDYSEEQIQTYVDNLAKYSNTYSAQVACFENGEITQCYCYGYASDNGSPMTNDTKIRIASLSKVLVAIEAMKMQEMGIVDIDSEISSYWDCTLPKEITLRNLLTHSSTLLPLDYETTFHGTVNQLKSSSSYSEMTVGSAGAWQYNNLGVGIAGTTLELASGMQLETFGNDYFFEPMDIDASWYSGNFAAEELASLYYHDQTLARSSENASQMSIESELGESTGYFAGALTISAYDFGKLMAMIANDGRYDGKQYLSENSIAVIEHPHFAVTEKEWSFDQCMPLRYKEGLYGESELYYHTGNAYGVHALASYNPSTTEGVVVVTIGAPEERDEQGIYQLCAEITQFIYLSQRNR